MTRSSHRLLPVLWLCAALSAAAARPASAEKGVAGGTKKTPAKVLVIGVDGVSLNLLVPMAKKGVAPVMGQLLREGTRANLDVIWPLRTPQVWTSAATGKLPGQHGIWDHKSNSYFNPPEIRTQAAKTVTSADRKSKAVWQLLDAKGIRTLTVGWMASWPADTLEHGIMVAPVELLGDRRQTTIKGSFYPGAKRMVAPKKYESSVQKLIVDPLSISDEALAPFADVPGEGSPLYSLPRLERYVYALRWSLARAQSVERISRSLARGADADLVMTYFQCTDSLLHRFWIFSEGEREVRERFQTHGINTEHAAELTKRFGGVVEACYRDVDTRIGRLLDSFRGPDTIVLLVSDHGFGKAKKPHKLSGEPYSGDHLDQGVFVAAGPGFEAGKKVDDVSVLDLTPLLLHIFGLPGAEDMRGRVPTQVFSKPIQPLKMIPSYEETPQLDAAHPKGYPPRSIGPRPVVEPEVGFFSGKGERSSAP